MNSDNLFPSSLASIFRTLRESVRTRFPEFPDAEYIVVNGFLFLRFFIPAIISPKQYGMLASVDDADVKAVGRSLTLLSKVVQNVANGVHFGAKEEHLGPLNVVVDTFGPAVRAFVDRICAEPPSDPDMRRGRSFNRQEDHASADPSPSTLSRMHSDSHLSPRPRPKATNGSDTLAAGADKGGVPLVSASSLEALVLAHGLSRVECTCRQQGNSPRSGPRSGPRKPPSLGNEGYQLCRNLAALSRMLAAARSAWEAKERKDASSDRTGLEVLFAMLDQQENATRSSPLYHMDPTQRSEEEGRSDGPMQQVRSEPHLPCPAPTEPPTTPMLVLTTASNRDVPNPP
eukprot:comp24309_c3_seq2/m.45708 comp24309_c3_seq2/g.45708  ORF comp24309_c3_seq2/g.45708 comp24309_c3_seq2/m.45708 type:complete len:344 (-) comp24309_c3_seq2:403-1434(-)